MSKIDIPLVLFFISFYIFSYCGYILLEQNKYEVINVDALKPYMFAFVATSIINVYLDKGAEK